MSSPYDQRHYVDADSVLDSLYVFRPGPESKPAAPVLQRTMTITIIRFTVGYVGHRIPENQFRLVLAGGPAVIEKSGRCALGLENWTRISDDAKGLPSQTTLLRLAIEKLACAVCVGQANHKVAPDLFYDPAERLVVDLGLVTI